MLPLLLAQTEQLKLFQPDRFPKPSCNPRLSILSSSVKYAAQYPKFQVKHNQNQGICFVCHASKAPVHTRQPAALHNVSALVINTEIATWNNLHTHLPRHPLPHNYTNKIYSYLYSPQTWGFGSQRLQWKSLCGSSPRTARNRSQQVPGGCSLTGATRCAPKLPPVRGVHGSCPSNVFRKELWQLRDETREETRQERRREMPEETWGGRDGCGDALLQGGARCHRWGKAAHGGPHQAATRWGTAAMGGPRRVGDSQKRGFREAQDRWLG